VKPALQTPRALSTIGRLAATHLERAIAEKAPSGRSPRSSGVRATRPSVATGLVDLLSEDARLARTIAARDPQVPGAVSDADAT
jgi:hypothetical protein